MREPVEALFPRYGRVAYRVLKAVIGAVFRRLYTIRVEGLENLPVDGPAILAANHVSFLDSFFLPVSVPRRVTYLAKAEYWKSWKTRWFVDIVGQIPVQRDDSKKSRAALEAGKRVLGANGLLGIYPEGTRSPDGRLYKGKTGVARMALETGVPVVPVGLTGTLDVMPKARKIPRLRGHVTVRFGQPIRVPDEAHHDPLALRSFVDGLMYEIMLLSGQEYVDRYADRKARPLEQVPVAAGVA